MVEKKIIKRLIFRPKTDLVSIKDSIIIFSKTWKKISSPLRSVWSSKKLLKSEGKKWNTTNTLFHQCLTCLPLQDSDYLGARAVCSFWCHWGSYTHSDNDICYLQLCKDNFFFFKNKGEK